MSLDDDVTELKAAVDAAVASGEGARTMALLERLWRLRPGPANASFVLTRAARVEPPRPRATVRVAVARSFTIEPVVPLARAAAIVHGVDMVVEVGGFNTFAQDLLDPTSFLHTERFDIVVLAVQTRDIAPELWEFDGTAAPGDLADVEHRVLGELTALIESFRAINGVHLVVHSLESPPRPTLGLADARSTVGQIAAVEHINRGLRSVAAAHPGVHVLDVDRLIADVGRSRWHDEDKWHAMRMPLRPDGMARLADEWVRFVFPMIGHVAKALVVDLDNTLWGGVVGEDGIDGIRLGRSGEGAGYRALQQSILDLHARGILLGICSKNNHADAIEVIEQHPEMRLRPHHFSAMRVDWNDKADNIRQLAAEWNIGLDAIAFIDDNPAECELVRQALPEVFVIELDRPPRADAHPLLGHPAFERLTLSQEDLRRAEMYAQQRERRQLEAGTGSLDDYLRSLRTTVSVERVGAPDVPRVAQLTQKTNQFNLTTRRYSEQEITGLIADPTCAVYAARASDRFGDHGLIGVVVARSDGDAWDIDTLLLSCRVIGRGVESAMLAVVAGDAVDADARTMTASFVPTAKNAPAAEFLPRHGFEAFEGDQLRWRRSLLADRPSVPGWIELTTTRGDHT